MERVGVALKNGGQSNERELWHSTGNTRADVVCMSEHGFDPTYSIGTALRGSGTDGNKYGIGVYFAEHALYSDVMRPGAAQEGGHEIVLAKVVLGNVKDYGAQLAPELVREPFDEGTGIPYDSWSGTENDLRGVAEIEAVLLSGSPYEKERAQLLVDEGRKYGRQYIVCRYQKAYPAYVVRYEVLQDAARSEPLSGAPPTAPALPIRTGDALEQLQLQMAMLATTTPTAPPAPPLEHGLVLSELPQAARDG